MSGLHDYDYPSLIDTGIGLDALPEVSNVKRVPLPPELVEQFGRILFFGLTLSGGIFLIFPKKQDLTFHANCLLEALCFLGKKIKKYHQFVIC